MSVMARSRSRSVIHGFFLRVLIYSYKRPQTATPAFIKVQPTGQNQQIFLNAKIIFKLGAIFRENAQRVQKFI